MNMGMRGSSRLFKQAVALLTLGLCSPAWAADGTWNSDANGTWSTSVATNPPWTGSVVASGSGFTADFNTVNLTADRTITLGEAITIGNLVFGDTTIATAGSWILGNGGTAANTLTLAGTTPTITVNALGTAKNVTISAVIAGGSGLTKAGAGTLVLSGTNTFTGGINVTAGTLSVGGNVDANLGAAGGSVTLSNNSTLQTTTDSGSTGAGRALIIGTGGGRLSVGGFSPRTMAFAIQGSDTLGLSATNSVIRLTGDNSGFTGIYSITLGGVSFEGVNSGPSGANKILIGVSGGLVALNTSSVYTTAQGWLSSGTIDTSSTGGIWLSGVNNSENVDFTGYNGLFLGISNLINLGAPNTLNYTGTITTADSVYRLGNSASAGHILNMNSVNQLTGARSVVIGNGTVVGTVMLSQSNDYSGGTTVNNNGNLIVANSNALGSGAVTVNAPIASVNSGLRLQGGVNIANTLNLAGLPNTADLGVLRSVSGANTWSGAVNLTGATRISADNVSGNSMTISGDVALGANNLSIVTGTSAAYLGGDIVISGAIGGTGALSKTNSTGTLTLSGNNTYSGATNISGGMVALGSASALGNGAGTLTINAGNGVAAGIRSTDGTARSISNAFAISNGNATNTYVFGAASGGTGDLTFTNTGTTALGTSLIRTFQVNNRTQFNGVFSGTGGGIAKTGSGTLVLNGVNTYTGTTTVSSGTLLVNGSLAAGSLVSVSSGASLGGGGTINGAVTVDGSITPGNSIGTLSVANDVTWNGSAGQDWKFELGAISGSSDLLALSGLGNDFLKGTGSDFRFDFLNTGVVGTFKLVDWDAATTFSSSDFTYTNLASGLSGSFAFNGSQLDFTVVAVPEPSTYALFGLGLGALAMLRRRKK